MTSKVDLNMYQSLIRIKSPKFKIRVEKKLVVLGDSELHAVKGGGYTEVDDETSESNGLEVLGGGIIRGAIIT